MQSVGRKPCIFLKSFKTKNMYSEEFFEGRSPNEIKRILEDNADRIEEQEYFVPFTEDQLQAERENFTARSIELAAIDDEFEKIKQEFKLKMKPVINAKMAHLKNLRTKGVLQVGNVYLLANQEEGYMYKYNSDGIMIEKRRLRPDEKVNTTLKFQSNVQNA